MAKRTRVEISLPVSMSRWIADRVEEGTFKSASDFLERAARRERSLLSLDDLERLALEALESGPSVPLTKSGLKRIKATLR